jgi:hypothetical protein
MVGNFVRRAYERDGYSDAQDEECTTRADWGSAQETASTRRGVTGRGQ